MRLGRGGTWVDGNVSGEETETEARDHRDTGRPTCDFLLYDAQEEEEDIESLECHIKEWKINELKAKTGSGD